MNPEDEARPVSDAQWKAMALIDELGWVWIDAAGRSITKRTAAALALRGFVKPYSSQDSAMLTEAGSAALASYRRRMARAQEP